MELSSSCFVPQHAYLFDEAKLYSNGGTDSNKTCHEHRHSMNKRGRQTQDETDNNIIQPSSHNDASSSANQNGKPTRKQQYEGGGEQRQDEEGESQNSIRTTTRKKAATNNSCTSSSHDGACLYFQQIMEEPILGVAQDTTTNHRNEISKQNLIFATKAKESAENQTNQLQQRLQELLEQLNECEEELKQSKLEVKLANDLWIKRQLQIPCQWNAMFRLLLDFKQQNGHLMVPHNYKHNDVERSALGRFVGNQRVFYKYYQRGDTKHIKEFRINILNRIGFIWNPKEEAWLSKYRELVTHVKQHGHCHVDPTTDDELHKWCIYQRDAKTALKRGTHSTLTPERIELLNKIHFPFDQITSSTGNPNKQMTTMVNNISHIGTHSTSDGTPSFKKTSTSNSASSKNRKRNRKRNGTPSESVVEEQSGTNLLEEKAKFGMTPDEMWNFRYEQLKEFHRIHGHVFVNKRALTSSSKRVRRSSDDDGQNNNNEHDNDSEEDNQKDGNVENSTGEDEDQDSANAGNDFGNNSIPPSTSNTNKTRLRPGRIGHNPLVSWLASQRNQYEYRRLGNHQMHTLTEDKIQKLEDLGVKWRKPKHEPRKS